MSRFQRASRDLDLEKTKNYAPFQVAKHNKTKNTADIQVSLVLLELLEHKDTSKTSYQ